MAETVDREMQFQQLIADYKNTFNSESGKRVLIDLAKFCLEKRDIFEEQSARKTDYNLGANAVIRHIRSRLEKNITEVKQETAIN